MKILTKKSLLVGLSSVFLGLMSASTFAVPSTMTLKLDDLSIDPFATGHEVIVTDQDFAVAAPPVNPDQSPVLGTVLYSGGIHATSAFDLINVTTGISKPVLGGPLSELSLTTVHVNSSGAGTLKVFLSDTDFTGVLPNVLVGSVGGIAGPGGTVTMEYFLDSSNTLFGIAGPTVTAIGPQGPFVGAFSDVASSGVFIPATPHSLTILATITHGSGTTSTSVDARLVANAPVMGQALLTATLLGLPLIGWLAWRRKSTKTINASFA